MKSDSEYKRINDFGASSIFETDHPGYNGTSPSTEHLIRKLRKAVNEITNPTQEDA